MAAGLLVMAAGSILAPACADNESSLFIRAAQAPDDECFFPPPSNDATVLLGGVLDVRVRATYSAGLIVGNQIVRRGDEEQIRTETSRIQLYAADVTLLDSGDAVIQRSDGTESSFEVPTTGFIDPGQGSEPGLGTAFVLIIDSGTADQLRAQVGPGGFVDIVASVIVRGRTLGGNELESAEFRFPISVCDGCLVDRSSMADDPANPAVDCDNAAELDEAPCFSGQDRPFDCCHGGVALCTAP